MEEIQERLSSELANLPYLGFAELNQDLSRIIEKKLLKPSVRSSFTVWVYEYICQCLKVDEGKVLPLNKDDSHLFREKLPFIVEMSMAAIYLLNQILDSKNQVDDKKNSLQYSMLRDLIADYVYGNCGMYQHEIERTIREIFRYVDAGQALDKKCNLMWLLKDNPMTIDLDSKLIKFINLEGIGGILSELKGNYPSHKVGIETYFKRNYLISSSLFHLVTKLIMSLIGYEGKEKANILQFADDYGIMMQLINDINDFVLEKETKNKNATDVLSDLKNGVMTLPIILHLNTSNGLIEAFLREPNSISLKGRHNEVLKEVILSGALSEAIKIAKRIADRCKDYIRKDSNDHLTALLDIARYNRYYYHIFRAKKIYKKKGNAHKVYRCEEHQSVVDDSGKKCKSS